jgi:hypothetical protein
LLDLVNGLEVAGKEFALGSLPASCKLPRIHMQRDPGDKIFTILVCTRMIFQFENGSRSQASGGGLSVKGFILSLQFIQTNVRQSFAFARFDVLARIIINLKLCLAMRTCHIGVAAQRSPGFLEIEIVERASHRLHFLLDRPVCDGLTPQSSLLEFVKRNLSITHERIVGADGIRQHHGVPALFVLEEEIDALLLHQSIDEIKIRFAVLNAVFPFRIRAGEFELIIVESMAFEDLLDDFRHRFLLEDPAIRGSREQP